MASGEPQMISANPAHYNESFKVFKDGTNMQDVKLQLLKTVVPKAIHHAIGSEEADHPTVSVLGVGSSKGEVDIWILEAILGAEPLKSHKPSIYNRIVEPNSKSISAFSDVANEWTKTSKSEVNFDWVQLTFQDYQTTHKHELNQFHLIHFIGSIYYMDPEETLRYCLEKELASKGVILVSCFNEDSFFARYQKEFHDTGIAPFPKGYVTFTINYILEIVKKNNWRHEYFEGIWQQDITVLEKPESRESKLLIDFNTHTINFEEVRGKEMAERVRQSMLALSQLKPDGRRVIDVNKYGAVLIYRS